MDADKPNTTGHLRLYEGKRGSVWYAKYRGPDGRQRQVRLGVAHNGKGRCPDGRLTKSMADAALRRLITKAEEGTLAGAARRSGHTVGDACAEFLRHREHEKMCADSTMRDYRFVRVVIEEVLGKDTPIENVTEETVKRFRQVVKDERGSAAATARKHFATLGGVLDLARVNKWIDKNPADDVPNIPIPRKSGDIGVVLDPEQVFAVARAAACPQDAALYTVAAFTGMRQGELRALRWDDVDFEGQFVHVRRNRPANTHGDKLPKSGRVRSVPLAPETMRALDGLSRREHFTGPSDHVFVNTVGGALHDDTIRKDFVKAVKRAGLGHLRDPSLPRAQRLRFHSLRHSFGSLMVRKFQISDVQAMMGHADISTTMIYVHHQPRPDAARRMGEAIAEAMQSCPELRPEDRASGVNGENSAQLIAA